MRREYVKKRKEKQNSLCQKKRKKKKTASVKVVKVLGFMFKLIRIKDENRLDSDYERRCMLNTTDFV